MCRLGGDEFLVLQAEVDRPSSVARLSRRVVDAIRKPFEINNYSISIGASVGVALIPRDGVTPEELIAKAEDSLKRERTESDESVVVKNMANVSVRV